MEKKQKHYKSEAEIKAAIDAKLQSAIDASVEADEQDKMNKQFLIQAENEKLEPHEAKHLKDSANECRVRAKKLRKRVKAIQDNQLPRLKNTLSAFQTTTMPFVNENEPVVLQPK